MNARIVPRDDRCENEFVGVRRLSAREPFEPLPRVGV